MGADKSATIVPAHGTLFVADVNTAMPVDWTDFVLNGSAPSGWVNLGHTSKKNTPSFTKDGGDKTVLDSWLQDSIDAIYASTQWGITFNSLQVDQENLDLAFSGSFDNDGGYIIPGGNSGVAKALVLLFTDGTGSVAFYMPNTSVVLGDSPSIDPAEFFELPVAVSILTADDDVIPAASNGIGAVMKIYKTDLTAAVATVSAATPSGAAATQVVRITGTGFLTATVVKFAAAAASSFEILSDERIDAVMPAGSAGSAPVTVINPGGTSNALAYTRA